MGIFFKWTFFGKERAIWRVDNIVYSTQSRPWDTAPNKDQPWSHTTYWSIKTGPNVYSHGFLHPYNLRIWAAIWPTSVLCDETRILTAVNYQRLSKWTANHQSSKLTITVSNLSEFLETSMNSRPKKYNTTIQIINHNQPPFQMEMRVLKRSSGWWYHWTCVLPFFHIVINIQSHKFRHMITGCDLEVYDLH